MIQAIARLVQRSFEEGQVHDHAGGRVGFAPQHHFGAIRMAVDAAAGLRLDRTVQRMCRVEPELLGDLEHQGMPIALWVCRLRRQRGWARQ